MDPFVLGRKLDYLHGLTKTFQAVPTTGIMADIAARMQRVCDSIEQDLLIGKGMKDIEPAGLVASHDRSVIRNALNDRLRLAEKSNRPDEKPYIEQLERLIHLFE
jgi:hypothetical protein